MLTTKELRERSTLMIKAELQGNKEIIQEYKEYRIDAVTSALTWSRALNRQKVYGKILRAEIELRKAQPK